MAADATLIAATPSLTHALRERVMTVLLCQNERICRVCSLHRSREFGNRRPEVSSRETLYVPERAPVGYDSRL
jgi:hypothetical protein